MRHRGQHGRGSIGVIYVGALMRSMSDADGVVTCDSRWIWCHRTDHDVRF